MSRMPEGALVSGSAITNAESSPGRLSQLVSGKKSKWVVLGVWLLLFVGLSGLAGKVNDVQKNDNSAWLPKSAESTAELKLEANFHPTWYPAVLLFAHQGGLTDADKQVVQKTAAALQNPSDPKFDIVVHDSVKVFDVPPGQPHAGEAEQILVPINPGNSGWNKLPDIVKAMRDTVGPATGGLEFHLTGPAGVAADEGDAFKKINGTLTYITLAVVVLILLIAYRSPLLWLLPIFTVFFALNAANAVIYLLAKHAGLTVNGQSAFILVVLVLGAGTDYALLLIARYREELRNYEDRHEAMAHALHRAGPAVVASSATVAVSMLVLLFAELNSTKGLGPVLAVGIVVAVLAMLTLLPALLVIFGRWVFWPTKPTVGSVEPTATGVWSRVGKRISLRPRTVWIGTAVILGALSIGITDLNAHQLTASDTFVTKPDSVIGMDVQAKYFPPASGQPIVVLFKEGARDAVKTAMTSVSGVDTSSVGTPQGTKEAVDGIGYLEITPTDPPDSPASRRTVERVRTAVHAVPGADAKVGGWSAVQLDTLQASSHDSKVIIPAILLVVFIILALLLRSLLAPLLLVGTVILSFGASMGISAMAFKGFGWNGVDTGMPLFAFVFLVALGIDYNIFLMTRIREESARRGTRRGALVGLSATGGVITWAGLVLAGTFGVLATLPIVPFAEIGFSVALGVLLDTMIVRSVLVTALTFDIGKKMWWPSKLSVTEPGDDGSQDDSLGTSDEAVLVQ